MDRRHFGSFNFMVLLEDGLKAIATFLMNRTLPIGIRLVKNLMLSNSFSDVATPLEDALG